MGRPKLNIAYMCPDDFPCEECERGHDKSGKRIRCQTLTDAEKIAALLDALKELGVDVMLVARADGKCPKCGQSIGATTYCAFCGEHLVALPKPPKEAE